MAKNEKTPGGSDILRHDEAAPPSDEIGYADDERLTAHFEKHINTGGMVFHEIVSDRIHIDVHMLPPGKKNPYNVLITSGMSAHAMNVPTEMEGYEQWQYAELCMILPKNWPLKQKDFDDEKNYWPVRLLKNLARLPHDYNTWLGWGHSIPNGDPAEPYAPKTKLTGAILIPPLLLGDEFFEVSGEPPLHIFQILPLTTAEMEYKLNEGTDNLLESLEKKFGDDIYGAIDPSRKSAV
jgi:hypothetical protein